jgi:hypothetical protein
MKIKWKFFNGETEKASKISEENKEISGENQTLSEKIKADKI